MSVLDRMLFKAYVKAYLICLVSLLSLYVVIDLFTNLDDFARDGAGLRGALGHIATFYMYQSVQIFDRLCEALVLLAAMFTIAWAQRNNELLPVLSAGVSTHRFTRPVLLGSLVFLTLGLANQEFLIPRVANQLAVKRDDPEGQKWLEVRSTFGRNGLHVEGIAAVRAEQVVKFMYVTLPENRSSAPVHLTAGVAKYVPPGGGRRAGGWMLSAVTPATLPDWDDTSLLEPISEGRYFLYTDDIDFRAVTRDRNWHAYASAAELLQILEDSESGRLAPIAVRFHMHLTRVFVGLTLVVIGLGLILRDQNRHVFISAGMSLAVCALFYGVVFAGKHLGETDVIAPALAAWLPVVLFAPFAVMLYDGIQT